MLNEISRKTNIQTQKRDCINIKNIIKIKEIFKRDVPLHPSREHVYVHE